MASSLERTTGEETLQMHCFRRSLDPSPHTRRLNHNLSFQKPVPSDWVEVCPQAAYMECATECWKQLSFGMFVKLIHGEPARI